MKSMVKSVKENEIVEGDEKDSRGRKEAFIRAKKRSRKRIGDGF